MTSGGLGRRRQWVGRVGSVLGALVVHLGMFLGLTAQAPIGPLAEGSSQIVTVQLVRSQAVGQAPPKPASSLAASSVSTSGQTQAKAPREAMSPPWLTARSPSPLPSPSLATPKTSDAKGQAGPSSVAAASVPDAALRDDYQRRLVAHIEAFKRYPPGQLGAHGAVQLVFEIDRRGGVVGVWVVKSSGVGILDVAAVDTVRRAQPVPPIPQELPGLLTMPLSVVFDEQG